MHKKGREFDVWIAEHLYGHKIHFVDRDDVTGHFWVSDSMRRIVPWYSAAKCGVFAYLLDDLAAANLRINLFYTTSHWNCELLERGQSYRAIGIHPEIQMAVCLAVANAYENGLRLVERSD